MIGKFIGLGMLPVFTYLWYVVDPKLHTLVDKDKKPVNARLSGETMHIYTNELAGRNMVSGRDSNHDPPNGEPLWEHQGIPCLLEFFYSLSLPRRPSMW